MEHNSFVCPYCNQPTTITSPDKFYNWTKLEINKPDKGEIGYGVYAITCPNTKCKKLYLQFILTGAKYEFNWQAEKIIQKWQLLPESHAKIMSNYIPEPIKQDYYEACRIRDLSSKASATLSRRCLQGMIRDFWDIKKPTLKDEINALEEKVDPLTWDAIDSVRKVGNIGAHMEKDINLIINVDPDEAQLLIELIEQLVDDWYVERHNKEERLNKIKQLANSKDGLKKPKVKK